MKQLFITLFMLALLQSCGKKSTGKPCLSRYQKMQECYRTYNPTHHPHYVQRVCGEKYPTEGCYK